MSKNYKHILKITNTFLVLIISGVSLFCRDIYSERINRITQYELMGMDLATILVSMIFILILLFTDYNKIKIKILSVGFLLYQFYIYSYFSFSGITSIFYLFYVLFIGISFILILATIIDIIKSDLMLVSTSSYPRKSISIYLILSILMVGIIEIKDLIVLSVILREKLNPFYSFYVLDLAFIFPIIIIAAILNYKKSLFGYILTGISLIKIVTILPGAVIFNDLFHRIYTGDFIDLNFDIISFFITLTGLIFLSLYIKNTKEDIGTSHNNG